jgi:hypothetical protein
MRGRPSEAYHVALWNQRWDVGDVLVELVEALEAEA